MSTPPTETSHKAVFNALCGLLSAIEDDVGIVHIEGRGNGKSNALRMLIGNELHSLDAFVPLVCIDKSEYSQWREVYPGAHYCFHNNSDRAWEAFGKIPASLPKVPFRLYVDDAFQLSREEREKIHTMFNSNANILAVRGIGNNAGVSEEDGFTLYKTLV